MRASHDALDRPAHVAPAPFPRWLIAVLGVSAAAALVLLVSAPSSSMDYWGIAGHFTDLHVYRWGGQYVRDGLPLYAADLLPSPASQAWRTPMAFTYTPFAAAMFVLLMQVSVPVMEAAWAGASLLCLVLVCRAMFSWIGYAPGPRLSWVSVLLAATMLYTEPVRMTLWLGQINLLLLALVVLDAAARTSRVRGLATGLAVGIKLTPGFLWLHYALTRQWRYALTGLGGFLLTIGIGWAAAPASSLHYWTGGLLNAERVGNLDAPSNQSANGVLAHYVFHAAPPAWAWFLAASACSILGLFVARRVHRLGQAQLAFVISGMTGCLASPFSWGHHWVWFVPLMAVLLHLLLAHARRGWARIAWLLPVALYFLVGAWMQTFDWPGQPGGVWVATGWFMSHQALHGAASTLLREPYIAVWILTIALSLIVIPRISAPLSLDGHTGGRTRAITKQPS